MKLGNVYFISYKGWPLTQYPLSDEGYFKSQIIYCCNGEPKGNVCSGSLVLTEKLSAGFACGRRK